MLEMEHELASVFRELEYNQKWLAVLNSNSLASQLRN